VPHWLLTIAATVVLAVPFIVLFLLFGDLTRFYFHAQHVPSDTGAAFAPRFTLTGLRLPAGDLSPAADAALAEARSDPATIELLVPPNQPARDAITVDLTRMEDSIATPNPAISAGSTDCSNWSPPVPAPPPKRSPK
jgi:hypothetical protein